MSGRCPLVGRLRERWLSGALPLVVDHPTTGSEAVCAAPSLWMMGRARAKAWAGAVVLQAAQPRGVELIADVVCALRIGATLAITGEPRAMGAGVSFTEVTWSGHDLLRIAERQAAAQGLRAGDRVHVAGPWTDPWLFARGVLAPLLAGCELHTTPPHEPAGAILARTDSEPHHIVGTEDGIAAAWPHRAPARVVACGPLRRAA